MFGAFLVGARNSVNGKFYPVTKVGTGFSEADLKKFYEELKPFTSKEPLGTYQIGKGIKPDFWVHPIKVWEIAFDSMTRSPLYKIGSLGSQGGISVRFPRLVRERADKQVSDANTTEEIIDMFEKSNSNSVAS